MKSAVVFGAGNIGRGFIGEIFAKSGFAVTFIDIDEKLVARLNKRGEYPVHAVDNGGENVTVIKNVTAVSFYDTAAAIDAVKTCDIIATAVGAANLSKIAGVLAAGLKARTEPVNVLVCENMIGANKALEQHVAESLSGEERERILDGAGFVEVSVGRMVPANSGVSSDPLALRAEPYAKLPYCTKDWKGNPLLLYGGEPCEDFAYHIRRKLYLHNLGHAAAGYAGSLLGYDTIDGCMSDAQIREFSKTAMDEAAAALSIEFPEKAEEIRLHVEELLNRFQNRALRDPVERVCRDPLRKLSPGDRLAGAYDMCVKNNIDAPGIEAAIAAAALYSDAALQARISGGGLEPFLRTHCGLTGDLSRFLAAYKRLSGWRDI